MYRDLCLRPREREILVCNPSGTLTGFVVHAPVAVPYAGGFYITAAHWFSASTSFVQSGCHDCALVVQHLRGDCAIGRACVRRGATHGHAIGRDARSMALGRVKTANRHDPPPS
jgi:hypothetical protein